MCFDFGVFRRTRTSLLNLSAKASERWEAEGTYIEGPYFLFSGGHIVGWGRGGARLKRVQCHHRILDS